MIALISKENIIRIYNMKVKLLHKPTSIDGSLDVLWFCGFSNEVSLVGWNSKMGCIQSLTNNVINWKITCLTRPKLSTMNDCTAAFLDVNNNLTFYNSSTKLSMEVLSPHHAMSRIDKISFAGHDRVFLFDYESKKAVASEMCLSSSVNMKWEVKKIYKCNFGQTPSCMFTTESNVVALNSDKMLRATYKL